MQQFVHQLQALFGLKNLGNPSYFLGHELNNTLQGVLLSQHKYITEILQKACMDGAKLALTSIFNGVSLLAYVGTLFEDPYLYCCIVGSLQYASITRLKITYVVNRFSQFMQHPLEPYWKAVKCIIRYLRGTNDHRLLFN